MEDSEVTGQTDLREYLRVLSRRKLVIALTVVVVVGLALAYSVVKKPTYSATASVLVPQQQASSALNVQNNQLPAAQSLQRSLADEQQFAKGDAVKTTAAKQLGYRPSISVGSSATADVLTFAAHSGSKAAAAAAANAYADAYITARRANQVSQYTQQVTALETSIAQLQAKANALAAGDTQRAALLNSINSLTQSVQQAQAASQLSTQIGPTVVNAASVPGSPSSPNPKRNGLLALVVGLVLGIGLAFFVERLDDGVNSREDAERASGGLSVVGLIPMVDAWRPKGSHHVALIEDPTSNVSEAYRTLRTSVQFLSIDEPRHIVGITSSVPDEGKTTAVANLAVSFARAGQRVIVVSCDLRRPRIHEFFGIDNAIGLTSVLIGQAKLNEAVKAVEGEPRLRIIPSGPIPPNPAEILSLDRVRELTEILSENCDIVLLDCPPVLPVTDALLLSRLVDGMLVLASTKSTSRRDLHRTCELLRQVQAPLLGTIINRVPVDGGYAYGYGYGYYGRYYESDTDLLATAKTRKEEPIERSTSALLTGPTGRETDQERDRAAINRDDLPRWTRADNGESPWTTSDSSADTALNGRDAPMPDHLGTHTAKSSGIPPIPLGDRATETAISKANGRGDSDEGSESRENVHEVTEDSDRDDLRFLTGRYLDPDR